MDLGPDYMGGVGEVQAAWYPQQ